MKVANRIAVSHTILIALLAVVLVCPILVLGRMQAAIARNAGQNFRLALETLSLMRGSDDLEHTTRRYFALPSAEMQSELKETHERLVGELANLQSNPGSDKTRSEAERMGRFLRDLQDVLIRTQPSPPKPELKVRQAGREAFPAELEEQFVRLRAQSYTLYQASLQTLNLEAESARKAGTGALTILWASGIIALAAGSGISFLVVRSVAGPLRQLAEGTRSLAEGKEFYRLDTSRSDELSQIAKDFNDLVRRLKPGNPE